MFCWRTLTATASLVWVSTPRKTTPCPPRPSSRAELVAPVDGVALPWDPRRSRRPFASVGRTQRCMRGAAAGATLSALCSPRAPRWYASRRERRRNGRPAPGHRALRGAPRERAPRVAPHRRRLPARSRAARGVRRRSARPARPGAAARTLDVLAAPRLPRPARAHPRAGLGRAQDRRGARLPPLPASGAARSTRTPRARARACPRCAARCRRSSTSTPPPRS